MSDAASSPPPATGPAPSSPAPGAPAAAAPAPPLPAVNPPPEPARAAPIPAVPTFPTAPAPHGPEPGAATHVAIDHASSGTHFPLDVTRTPLLRTLLKLPLKKLTIWACFLGLLVLLSDFFPLIFMTFVLSYIASSVVNKIEPRFSARWIPVVLFFSLVVTAVVGFVWILVPQITGEAKTIRAEVSVHKGWNKWLDDKLRTGLGPDLYDRMNAEFGVDLPGAPSVVVPVGPQDGDLPTPTPMTGLGATIAHVHSPSLSAGVIGHVSTDDRAKVLQALGAVISGIWKGVVYAFLTIIFSLMLVWGLPDFMAGLERLKSASRVKDIYLEVAPSIGQFGRLLGRAFEAQTIIAACNTLITFGGMKLLGIPGSFLLSVIVFVCSFIPVAGVWISTAPIAVTGLLMPGGGLKILVGVVLMVTVAHLMEAYVLNPRIYGHHMKMNPLAVLVILIIAEHTVGIWGLVVAIPLATYIWRYVVLGEEEEGAPQRPHHKKHHGKRGAHAELPPAAATASEPR